MTLRTQLVILGITLVSLILIVRLVRRGQVRAQYLVLWISLCLFVLPLVAFPRVINKVSDWLGVSYPPATLFLGAISLLFFVVIHFSWELSRLEERTRTLAEELAFLRLTAGRHEKGARPDNGAMIEVAGVAASEVEQPAEASPRR